MPDYTKAERAAIIRAFDAITYAASMSWNDTRRPHEALKLERAQAFPGNPSPTVWARARVVKLWHEGCTAPDTPSHEVAGYRPGALLAFMMGADMAARWAGDDSPRGDATRKAASLCPEAVAAYEAQSARELDSLK